MFGRYFVEFFVIVAAVRGHDGRQLNSCVIRENECERERGREGTLTFTLSTLWASSVGHMLELDSLNKRRNH